MTSIVIQKGAVSPGATLNITLQHAPESLLQDLINQALAPINQRLNMTTEAQATFAAAQADLEAKVTAIKASNDALQAKAEEAAGLIPAIKAALDAAAAGGNPDQVLLDGAAALTRLSAVLATEAAESQAAADGLGQAVQEGSPT